MGQISKMYPCQYNNFKDSLTLRLFSTFNTCYIVISYKSLYVYTELIHVYIHTTSNSASSKGDLFRHGRSVICVYRFAFYID